LLSLPLLKLQTGVQPEVFVDHAGGILADEDITRCLTMAMDIRRLRDTRRPYSSEGGTWERGVVKSGSYGGLEGEVGERLRKNPISAPSDCGEGDRAETWGENLRKGVCKNMLQAVELEDSFRGNSRLVLREVGKRQMCATSLKSDGTRKLQRKVQKESKGPRFAETRGRAKVTRAVPAIGKKTAGKKPVTNSTPNTSFTIGKENGKQTFQKKISTASGAARSFHQSRVHR